MEAAAGQDRGSPPSKPSKFSVYQNPTLSAALTAISLKPSKSTFLCILSLSSASAFALLSTIYRFFTFPFLGFFFCFIKRNSFKSFPAIHTFYTYGGCFRVLGGFKQKGFCFFSLVMDMHFVSEEKCIKRSFLFQ